MKTAIALALLLSACADVEPDTWFANERQTVAPDGGVDALPGCYTVGDGGAPQPSHECGGGWRR